MKFPPYVYLSLCLIIVLALYRSYRPIQTPITNFYNDDNQDEFLHLQICNDKTQVTPSHFNYLGSSLISNSSTDLVLCPGDAFGDLNNLYVTLQYCHLTMHHEGKIIWSSKIVRSYRSGLCAASLQKDGNLVVYLESGSHHLRKIRPKWSSNTDFNPKKTELRVKDQQLQIVQTSQFGSQRVFFAGENSRGFREDLGAPKQIAKDFFIKHHNLAFFHDGIILRRNEYIGDLNDSHLILQTNCELLLMNNNRIIWSFAESFKPDGDCVLRIREENSIGISYFGDNFDEEGMSILPLNDFTIIESQVTFKEDQLLIIQTLKNESQITFYSEPGQDHGLKLKRELKQIAENNITRMIYRGFEYIKQGFRSDIILNRMEYIGHLDGLHLILQDDCALVLANGQEELWRLEKITETSLMECSIREAFPTILTFNGLKNQKEKIDEPIRIDDFGDLLARYELSLEKNMMIMTVVLLDNATVNYYTGKMTNGTWFRFIAESSLVVNANNTNPRMLPSMGFVGDINGIYTIVNRRGNWILFNKTEVIWESGTTNNFEGEFDLILKRDGNLTICLRHTVGPYCIWSTQNSIPIDPARKVSKSELLVKDNEMWLIHTYDDGSSNKYKALEGTNSFTVVPNDDESTALAAKVENL